MTSTYLESKSTNLEFEQILNFSVIHQSRNVLSSLFLQFRGIDTKQKVKHLWCAHFSWFHTIFPRFLLKLTKLQNCPGFSRGTVIFQGFPGRDHFYGKAPLELYFWYRCITMHCTERIHQIRPGIIKTRLTCIICPFIFTLTNKRRFSPSPILTLSRTLGC